MYGALAWNPILRKDANLIEQVQKRFTKNIRGMQDDDGNDLSYAERLQKLNILLLARRQQYADMAFASKALHGLVDRFAVSFKLEQKTSCTRGDGIKLNQRRATTHASSHLFAVHAPSAWNKLSLDITDYKSFKKFERLLLKYLSAEQ